MGRLDWEKSKQAKPFLFSRSLEEYAGCRPIGVLTEPSRGRALDIRRMLADMRMVTRRMLIDWSEIERHFPWVKAIAYFFGPGVEVGIVCSAGNGRYVVFSPNLAGQIERQVEHDFSLPPGACAEGSEFEDVGRGRRHLRSFVCRFDDELDIWLRIRAAPEKFRLLRGSLDRIQSGTAESAADTIASGTWKHALESKVVQWSTENGVNYVGIDRVNRERLVADLRMDGFLSSSISVRFLADMLRVSASTINNDIRLTRI